ncbi:MAG: hypothetical protein A3F90_11420 [Deltaproteobacteria bacterium RIFCSPLOWO2_12_FULL_60_19]|nr:MAG: hypothetical protein A3F90_11420 [Deltaproteobacteria bacterium RIFCSPLOWO2_12_FULL_60_19]
MIVDGSDDLFEAPRTVKDSIDLNCFAADLVERQVVANDKDSITGSPQLRKPGDDSHMRVEGEHSDGAIEFFDEGYSPFGVVAGDPIMDRQQVPLGGG